jgi:hypothetical protein
LKLDRKEAVEEVVDIEVAGEAIKMMEIVGIDNQIIVAEKEEEDTLIGTTTTKVEKDEPSKEEAIEVVAEQIITKHQMTPKHSETREKNK